MKRLPAIDLVRGLAVVLMVMHHVVDAWTRAPDREGTLWKALRHLGGVPAPGFLVLAGLSAALLAARAREKGVPTSIRAAEAVRRGLYVFGIAFAFRLFVFVGGLNRWSEWRGIFRVDVLNCMGLALVLVGGLGALAGSRRSSIVVGVSVFVAFVAPAPWIYGRELGWDATFVANYVAGAGPLVLFPAFPWIGFVGAGWVLGEVTWSASADEAPRGFATTLLFGGLMAVAVPVSIDALLSWSPFPPHNWWRASPAYVVVRIGIQMTLLGLALRWTAPEASPAGRLLLLFGRHSLFVYVFHLELAYGLLVKPLERDASLTAALLGTVAILTLFAYGCAWLERREGARPRAT